MMRADVPAATPTPSAPLCPPARAGGGTLRDARRFCAALARAHYENFPVGSRWIPPGLRSDVYVIYAFARMADDFADEAEHAEDRLERLGRWRAWLHEAGKGRAEHPVFVALADTLERHRPPLEWLERLIEAFEWDVRRNRHDSWDSLLEYAKHSADPVGRLVLWIHGYREEALFALSDRICSALQFANFWQDVAGDLRKNRIYLPREDMARVGYTEADLFAHTLDGRFRELMRLQIGRTRELFSRGRALADRVGRRLGLELRLTWLGGMRILERIEASRYDVFGRRPTLGLRDKGLLAWRAFRWVRG